MFALNFTTMQSLKFTNAEAIQYADLVKGEVTFRMRVVEGPASGDNKEIGLKSLNKGAGIYFDILDDDFNAVVEDGLTGLTNSFPITWEPGVFDSLIATDYTIRWEAGMARFFINGVNVATVPFSDYDLDLASTPMSIYVKNQSGVGDDMYIDYIEAKGFQSYL